MLGGSSANANGTPVTITPVGDQVEFPGNTIYKRMLWDYHSRSVMDHILSHDTSLEILNLCYNYAVCLWYRVFIKNI